ncbi:hypothetical protein [Nitratireductor sp. GCM10026969]|uniref:hypothetical protein n=1 Tax=Nitratireductor sp. GCM10026969 TaxID=3252645 RepID=UPI003621A920
MTQPLTLATDRALSIPAGSIVKTAYIPVESIKLACRDRMAVGDVEAAYRKRLQIGDSQPWPCPNGHWEGERFVIHDGRHEFVATLMLGHSHLLVAWVEADADQR